MGESAIVVCQCVGERPYASESAAWVVDCAVGIATSSHWSRCGGYSGNTGAHATSAGDSGSVCMGQPGGSPMWSRGGQLVLGHFLLISENDSLCFFIFFLIDLFLYAPCAAVKQSQGQIPVGQSAHSPTFCEDQILPAQTMNSEDTWRHTSTFLSIVDFCRLGYTNKRQQGEFV